MLAFGLQEIKTAAEQARRLDAKMLCDQADQDIIDFMENILKHGKGMPAEFIRILKIEREQIPAYPDVVQLGFSFNRVGPHTDFIDKFLEFPVEESIPALQARIDASKKPQVRAVR
jgi:hypothetical protein